MGFLSCVTWGRSHSCARPLCKAETFPVPGWGRGLEGTHGLGVGGKSMALCGNLCALNAHPSCICPSLGFHLFSLFCWTLQQQQHPTPWDPRVGHYCLHNMTVCSLRAGQWTSGDQVLDQKSGCESGVGHFADSLAWPTPGEFTSPGAWLGRGGRFDPCAEP